MSYFKSFPLTIFEFNGQQSAVRDILRRAKFLTEYKDITDLYNTYTIKDGDTPTSLALSYYGSTSYHWVILMFNEIHNIYFEWPLEYLALENYCKDKYGANNIYAVKWYEKNGFPVGQIKEFKSGVPWVAPPVVPSAVAVTFIDYETKLNDEKREIRILRPELLGDFISQLEKAINV